MHLSISVKEVRATRYFSPFSSFRERRENVIFGNSQNVLIFLAQMNNIMLGNVGFKIFCNDITALSESNLI